jgi:Domain of unknown function (DUF4153)
VLFAAAAVAGGRGWRGVLLTPLGIGPRSAPGIVAVARGAGTLSPTLGGAALPAIRGTLLAGALLGVFGLLFASADGAFAHLTSQALPDTDLFDELPARAAVFLAASALAGGLALSAGGEGSLAPGRGSSRRLGTIEATAALGALVALFAAFVAVQIVVLFGGDRHVLDTAGLTYAEYAHQGFAQLLVVAALVLAVVGATLRWVEPRPIVRALLLALCALTLVVVASALHRLDIYVDAFGATRLRLDAASVCGWVGGLLVLAGAAVAVGRRGWLPRAAALLTAATAIAFAALNPDAYVADRNVDRYERSGKLDAAYLQSLSDDAAPALARLPAGMSGASARCARVGDEGSLMAVNVARARARELLCR